MSCVIKSRFKTTAYPLNDAYIFNGLLLGQFKSSGQTYTVDTALDRLDKIGSTQWRAIIFLYLSWVFIGTVSSVWPSLLTDYTICTFSASRWQGSLIGTCHFIAYAIFGALNGILADKCGTKNITSLGCLFAGYFMLLTSFAPSFFWVIFLDTLVGACCGAVLGTSATFTMELLPKAKRELPSLLLQLAFGMGGVLAYTIAMVMTTMDLSWRYASVLSSLLALPPVLIALTLPESPHHYVSRGEIVKAEKVLAQLTSENRMDCLPGKLAQSMMVKAQCERKEGNEWLLLFYPPRMFVLTMTLLVLRILTNVLYAGYFYFTPSLLKSIENEQYKCPPYSSTDYLRMMWSISSELLSVPVLLVASHFLRQRAVFFWTTLLSAIPLGFLLLPGLSTTKSFALVFASRTLHTAFNQSFFLYTPQIFPSACRGRGVGLILAFGVIGAAAAPFVGGFLVSENLFLGKLFFFILCGIVTVGSVFLPDTSGKDLENPMYAGVK